MRSPNPPPVSSLPSPIDVLLRFFSAPSKPRTLSPPVPPVPRIGGTSERKAPPGLTEFQFVTAITQYTKSFPVHWWVIGVTDKPPRRFGEHHHPPFWRSWPSLSEYVGRNVEKHFKSSGMRGGVGGLGAAGCVYVFLKPPVPRIFPWELR